MKLKYLLFLLVLIAVLVVGPTPQIFAQSGDTLTVDWQNADGIVQVDALYNTIMGDTAANGSRLNLNRVYKLKSPGYYWNHSTISNKGWTLRIVGEKPGNTLQTAPPVLQMVTESGAGPGQMFQLTGDFVFKNLYIIGSDELGVQTYYQPIEVDANNLRCIVDNCVFERSNFSMLAWQGGGNNDIFITNCIFRNLQERPPTQQWAGRGISIWTDEDTVIVENNTFFNVNMTAFQLENGSGNYVRFNHNTLVNIGRSIHSTAGAWWKNAYFGNLLLMNVFWDGEGACDYAPSFAPNRDPRAFTTGMFSIGTLPAKYGMTDATRRIVFTNAAAFLDPFFKQKYDDTVRVQPYCNAITDSFFTTFSVTNDGHMYIGDTTWMDAYPNFTNNPDDQAFVQLMYDHITASRGYQYYNTGIRANTYFYDLPTDPATGDTLWTVPSWPIPENFTYTNQNLMTAGSDGLPLGDLNWFPNKKAEFDADKAKYVKTIEDKAGAVVIDTSVWSDQAENGTPGDGAKISVFSGPAWYTLVGGSSIEWTFNLPAAKTVDMTMGANINNNGSVGFDFILNGSNIHDAAHGWGQFVFDLSGDRDTPWKGKSKNTWYDVTYKPADIQEAGAFNLPAGENTIKLQYSWNGASYSYIDIYEDGTANLLASLKAPSAVNNGATPGGEGTFVPEGFKSVKLGSGGSITFTVNFPSAGNYLVRAFYQNVGTPQTGSVKLDGSEVTTMPFRSKADSTSTFDISPLFTVASAGSHTLTITGSNVNVDWLQLIRRTTITGIDNEGQVPETYSLLQNYPNPFNPTTTINFTLGKSSNVKLIVYDILGRKVTTLINNSFMNAGPHSIQFNASILASGIYFYRIEAGDFRMVKKMLLLK